MMCERFVYETHYSRPGNETSYSMLRFKSYLFLYDYITTHLQNKTLVSNITYHCL
jgi:hypothetical protein